MDHFTYESPTTKCTWKAYESENGFVAVCYDLLLTVEGNSKEDTVQTIHEAEQLLINELKEENISIEQYITSLNELEIGVDRYIEQQRALSDPYR